MLTLLASVKTAVSAFTDSNKRNKIIFAALLFGSLLLVVGPWLATFHYKNKWDNARTEFDILNTKTSRVIQSSNDEIVVLKKNLEISETARKLLIANYDKRVSEEKKTTKTVYVKVPVEVVKEGKTVTVEKNVPVYLSKEDQIVCNQFFDSFMETTNQMIKESSR